jgi:regulation of enolase protein 1 (concanavalin A-like superfamily)
MMRVSLGVVMAGFAVSITEPALPDDRPAQTIPGWGAATDPDGDCKIRGDGDKLTIEVPATKHDLSVEVGDVSAPRVLREIEGDFIIQVKVTGNVRHAGKRTSDQFLAYHGAGLLIWLDGQTYIRLERAAVVAEEEKSVHYVNFELRKGGQRVPAGDNAEIPDRDTYVRLERRGNRICGLVSDDGVRWLVFDPITVELPRTLQVGVAAINTSTEPFKAQFSELEVYKKESKTPGR